MYKNGQRVPQDYATAVKWWRKAADEGDARSQFNLGIMYDIGRGVPQDYIETHKWYKLAPPGLNTKEEHGQAVKNRDKVASFMTPEQLAKTQERARELKPK